MDDVEVRTSGVYQLAGFRQLYAVHARSWFNSRVGNTHHTVRIQWQDSLGVNQDVTSGIVYGYGTQIDATAKRLLSQIVGRDLTYADYYQMTLRDCTQVQRKCDLHH